MKCPACGKENENHLSECLYCGIIFSKYNPDKIKKTEPYEYSEEPGFISELLLKVPEKNELPFFIFKSVFFIVFLVWGIRLILNTPESNYAGESFWHLINLPFHETGHIIFRPFGSLMMSMGGTIMQLLMPLICMGVFLIKTRDTFAASFTLWWFGENLLDIAPYINDARSLTLPLIGGNTGQSSPYGFHDWEFILTETGLLRFDHTLAWLSHITGSLLIILSFIWGGYILFKMFKNGVE